MWTYLILITTVHDLIDIWGSKKVKQASQRKYNGDFENLLILWAKILEGPGAERNVLTSIYDAWMYFRVLSEGFNFYDLTSSHHHLENQNFHMLPKNGDLLLQLVISRENPRNPLFRGGGMSSWGHKN